jgi:ATP-dependent Clp protease ATP-binding subunit ClpA
VFEFFDDNARRIIRRTSQESNSLNHTHIGTEHLVLSLLGDDPLIRRSAETSYPVVRTIVEAAIGAGPRSTDGYRPFTPEMKATVRRSIDVMMRYHHFPLTPLHLFIAMLQNEEGIVHSLLDYANVNRPVFYGRLDHMLSTTPAVWSSFHTRLPAVVRLHQRSYARKDILRIHENWQPVS